MQSTPFEETRPWLRLRQIALLAPALAPLEALIGDILGLTACHRDPAVAEFGLENVLFPIGAQFLEIVAPVTPDCAGARQLARQGGPGGYMVITQCDEHAPFKARAEALRLRIVNAFETPTFVHMQLHPRDTGGSFLEIDEQRGPSAHSPDGPWYPAGDHWQHLPASRVNGVVAVELSCDDPREVAIRWATLTGCELHDVDRIATLEFDNAIARFLPATKDRHAGLIGIHLQTQHADAILHAARQHGLPATDTAFDVAGIRITLV